MADVCLILEGTYPFAVGGVSSWVHSLVSGLGDIEFALVHMTSLEEGGANKGNRSKGTADPGLDLDSGSDLTLTTNGTGGLRRELKYVPPPNLSEQVVVPLYALDLPYDEAQRIISEVSLPEAKVYHALSTGYAGLLAAQLKEETRMPFILTEHGIYWKEIRDGAGELECGFKVVGGGNGHNGNDSELVALRHHWTETFRNLARHTYGLADAIVTVCDFNRELQLQNGAPESRSLVIPNGLDAVILSDGPPRWDDLPYSPRVGFVGRVSPIKDVETFIRSAAIVRDAIPGATFEVIGPAEDPAYFQRCRELAASSGLDGVLSFGGPLEKEEIYDRIDLLVLTSISEAQPMVILEAGSAGRPVVATDVGGCAELLGGRTPEDAALGPSGLVTPPSDPGATAGAVIALCRDPSLARRMGRAGQERVKRFYGRERFLGGYRNLYHRFITRGSHH